MFLPHELWLLLTWVLALQHPVVRYFTGSQLCEEILFGFDFPTHLKPFWFLFWKQKREPPPSPTHFSHIFRLERLWTIPWRQTFHLSNHSHPSVAIFQFYYTLSQDDRREKWRVTHTTWEKKKPWILTAVCVQLPFPTLLCCVC